MRVLITGGAGFIASHLVKFILETTDWIVICIDKLSYSSKAWGRYKTLDIYQHERLTCLTWDLCHELSDGMKQELGAIDLIIHMAAETHVDRSIKWPVETIQNNIMSTVHILEYARSLKSLQMIQYFSTDEVFGPAEDDVAFKETDPHNPKNPYAASKAASEDICMAYQNTYGLPLVITNLMNAYGIMQYPEKFIPIVINRVLNGEKIFIHTFADGTRPGTRHYIHVDNISSAVLFILQNVKPGAKINIRGEVEIDNLELAKKIAKIIGKDLKYELIRTDTARPGHDSRYALDGTLLEELGWKYVGNFDDNLKELVTWTLNHPEWLKE